MRVLIAAGGTGGHIYPGIAVAQEIKRRYSASAVRFVGTAHGLETRLVPRAGFELSLIESAGLKNVSLAAKIRGLLVLPKSFFAARRVIRDFAQRGPIPPPPPGRPGRIGGRITSTSQPSSQYHGSAQYEG